MAAVVKVVKVAATAASTKLKRMSSARLKKVSADHYNQLSSLDMIPSPPFPLCSERFLFRSLSFPTKNGRFV